MGAKHSSAKVPEPRCRNEVSIFHLLLEHAGCQTEEASRNLFRRLLDININDVSYEAIEIYCKHFIVDNLLNLNLRHGNLYRYWDCYSGLLEDIVADKLPSSRNTAVVIELPAASSSSAKSALETSVEDDGLAGSCSSLICYKQAEATSSRSRGMKSSKSHVGARNTMKSLLSGGSRASFNKQRNSKIEESKRSVDGGTPYDMYKQIACGKGNVTRLLSIFAISRIICKTLVGKINTTELLFHMDYLSYYMNDGSLSFFTLKDDKGHAITTSDERRIMSQSCSYETVTSTETTGPESTLPPNEDIVDAINDCSLTDEVMDAKRGIVKCSDEAVEPHSLKCRGVTVIHCREENKIRINLTGNEAPSTILDMILAAASERWYPETTEALKCGFCLIDKGMRIFSLYNISHIIEHAEQDVEFMAIPFCTSSNNKEEGTSHFQRLISALYSYITAEIRSGSNSHDVFLKASQSMAADVLIILLSCIVMRPYLFVGQDADEGESAVTEPPAWIKELRQDLRSLAPLYYIHVDSVRLHIMLDRGPEVLGLDIKSAMEYALDHDENVKYGLLGCLNEVIGTRGLEDMGRWLAGLLKMGSSSFCNMYMENLRNHYTLMLLLLLRYRMDSEAYMKESLINIGREGQTEEYKDAEISSPDNIAKILDKVGLHLPNLLVNLQDSAAINSRRWLDTQLSQHVVFELAKALRGISHTKLCSNELLLVLIDVLSGSQSFEVSFYRGARSFIKELLNAVKKRSAMGKGNTEDVSLNKSRMLRTMTRIVSHYVHHHKTNDVDELSLEVGTLLHTMADLLQWNFELQKDRHLVNSVILLINQIVEMPVIINRSASEGIWKHLFVWISKASSYMDTIMVGDAKARVASINFMMLITMVAAMLTVIKAALSLVTLDSNLAMIHATLSHCDLEAVETLLYQLRDEQFKAIFEENRMEALIRHASKMLNFVSLIIRTFVGFKMQSMHLFTVNSPGFPSSAVLKAVSELIREINEETTDTKSGLALAITQELETVSPPVATYIELYHYHMSQLWIAAYSGQKKFGLWSYNFPNGN